MEKYERPDSTEPMLAADPTENSEANEPAEPIDKIDPADPIERIEPAEPIDRIDPVEPIDRIDPADPDPDPDPDPVAPTGTDEPRLFPMGAFSQQGRFRRPPPERCPMAAARALSHVCRPSAVPCQPPEANLCHQRDGRRCGRGG